MLNGPIEKIIDKECAYHKDISHISSVISFLACFNNISEADYIEKHSNGRFEYKPMVYSFIQKLYEAELVVSKEEMNEFLKIYKCNVTDSCSCYNLWLKDMNAILSDEKKMENVNLYFLKLAITTLVHLEKVIPGSWGFDIENGNWKSILTALYRLYGGFDKIDNNCVC